MRNYKITKAVANFCRILLLLTTLMVTGGKASSYGFLPNIEQRRDLLLYAAIEHNKISFCLRIDGSVAARFFDDSIEYEIREAIETWLRAVPELNALKIVIARVACDNPELNLMVEISSPQSSNPHMAWASYDSRRPYVLIFINTAFRYVLRSERYESVDFAYFDRIRNPTSQAYRQFIQTANQQQLPPWEMADMMRRADIRGINWPEQIRFSSYPMLLHEIGHAFGLCDTSDEEIADCDASTLRRAWSSHQPGSVMKSNGFFYLDNDDIDGITALVRAHEGGPYCLKDLRVRPPRITPVGPLKGEHSGRLWENSRSKERSVSAAKVD